MPDITRQRAVRAAGNHKPKSVASGESVLDRVAPLRETKIGRLKASLYGFPKTGKTRLACTFPKPLLLIGAEDGTASVVGTKGVDFIQLRNCDEFSELVEGPITDGKWATVVLDTGTKMRQMRIQELFNEMGMEVPERKPFIYADKVWKQVWIQCGQDLRKFWSPLLDLPNKRDLNVVMICQEQTITEDEEGDSEIIKPAIGSALGKSLCMFVNAECDYICQTFIRAQTAVKETKDLKGRPKQTEVKTGKKEFCLRVGPHETFITGFRLPLGRPPLPDIIVDPSYDKVRALIEGK